MTHSINQLRSKTPEDFIANYNTIKSVAVNNELNNKRIAHISSLDEINNLPVIDFVLTTDFLFSNESTEAFIKRNIEGNPHYAQYKTIGCISSSLLSNKAKELSFDQVKTLALNPKRTGLDEVLIRKWFFLQEGYSYPDSLLFSLFRN